MSVLRAEEYLGRTQARQFDMKRFFPAGSKGKEPHIVRKVPQAIKTVDFSLGEEVYSNNKIQKRIHPLSLQMRKKVILAEHAVNFQNSKLVPLTGMHESPSSESLRNARLVIKHIDE